MTYPLKNLFILLFIVLLTSCNNTTPVTNESKLAESSENTTQAGSPELIYGIPADSFNLIRGKIRRNSFISDLLIEHGVSMPEIDKVLENSRSIFDVRKIRPGQEYILFCEKEGTGRAKYMVYEDNLATSYIFSFNDSLNITPFKKKITTQVKYASGTIETSLWNAIEKGGFDPALAAELSDIFAWTVDFFGLQKGDKFKVVYEEMLIDDKPFKTGKIYSASFISSGTTFTAIPFIQNGIESFFDAEGKSLKKAFLKAPLKFSRISSRFSSSRMHPILKIRRPHFGVDYAAPSGTPVHSIGDGKIISVTNSGGEGRMVKIKHNGVYSTAYMHLSGFAPGLKPGKVVKQGEVIGFVGSSGLSTGPHLDFRFYMNGSPVDPLKVYSPPAEPISQENLANFEKVKEVGMGLLETIN
jgi:murein DD-endopeptidase MepM/ murein hydrolase activator NlpD